MFASKLMHLKHIRWNAGDMGHLPSDASLKIGLSFPIHGTFGFQLTVDKPMRSLTSIWAAFRGSVAINAVVLNNPNRPLSCTVEVNAQKTGL
jgi:hypothetical protein